MNQAITRIFLIGVVLFIAVVVNLTWIMGVRADWYAQRPENKRSFAQELKIKRGDIIAFDDSVLATSKRRSGYYYRQYPQGSLAAQLIGYSSARYGRSGLESEFNAELSGQSDDLTLRRWVDQLLGRQQEGASLALTLVPAVQKVAQTALEGKVGAIVALDPSSGAIIASASSPTYDLSTLDEDWDELNAAASAPLLNRPTQGLYPPGSSFKVVTAAAGLEEGVVTPTTQFVDTGTYRVGGGKVTNYGGEVYGAHDFSEALTYSINTTFGKVGNDVGRERLVEVMTDFGFYGVPPLTLPDGEVAASGRYGDGELLPTDAAMDDLAVAWAACGQEQVLATPLQMALVAAAVANDGKVMKPYVVRDIIAPNNAVMRHASPEVWTTAMDSDTAAELTAMMKRVVSSGTGTSAALQGVSVAGKTGTAERGDGTNLAWFIAFAPADEPEVAVAVVVEGVQTTGGETAAPLAAAVLKSALAQASLP
ncbi:MAG: penicillin-binding transpeptidase domain-containing protein [Thermoleophilia bacterium]